MGLLRLGSVQKRWLHIEDDRGKISQIHIDMLQLQNEKKTEFEVLSSLDGVPEKLRKQGDALLSSVKGLHVQEQRQFDKVKEIENEMLDLQNTKKELIEEHAKSCIELDKIHLLIDQREQSMSELKKELEMTTMEADQYLADRVNLDMQLKAAQTDHKHEQEILAQHVKEKDRVLRKLKHIDNQLNLIQETMPTMIAEKEKVHHQVQLAESERKKATSCVEELKKEFDVQMQNYLGIETISKDVSTNLSSGYKEVERLENEVLESIELEYARHQQMGELASLREHMCRLMSSKLQMCNEAKEKIRIADLVIGFLKKKDLDLQDHFNKFIQLYNLMRAQRNKFINLIQEIIDEKLIEVDRLNGFINTAEKEMAMFRKQYETCVLDRNHVGISLIDRNDELCILYEKSNVQEELFKISDIEMSKRDNEVAFLKHQVGSLERSILICYTFVPKSRELRDTISALKHELKRVRAESERLSDLVERPENTARWKLLEGLDPSEMQLVAKLTDIEEHLSEREDQSLEKDLILEEVTALAEDVRKQTAEGWKENLPIGKKLNYYQHCIRIITRRMMATVSEFSLVQATTMSLQKEKDALSLLLEEAYDKLDAGEAPTADAEREWARMEQEQPAIGESNRSTASLLTGEQRTNAYIQEELELPKPFGVHAPFKPSEPGSTMRHIRRPKPKPIEV